MSEGVPVSATDELRERLRVVLAENGVDEAPATLHSWRCEYPERYGKCDCIAELVTDLVAEVAEARTEQREQDAERLDRVGYGKAAKVLRGVGNQSAELESAHLPFKSTPGNLNAGVGNQNAEPERDDPRGSVADLRARGYDPTDPLTWWQETADQKGTEQ